MTAQYPEILIYDGVKKEMDCTPELSNNESKIQLIKGYTPTNPACWRGYVGTWEIKNDKLFLNKILGKFKLRSSLPIFANWFSGTLIIPNRKLQEYNHHSFVTKHEQEQITVVSGRVIKSVVTVKYEQTYKSTATIISDYEKQNINRLLTTVINDAESASIISQESFPEQSLIIIQFKTDKLLEKYLGMLVLCIKRSKPPISLNISMVASKLLENTEVESLIILLKSSWAKEISDFLGVEFSTSISKPLSFEGSWISFEMNERQSTTQKNIEFGDDMKF